jgi:hypothetical protein
MPSESTTQSVRARATWLAVTTINCIVALTAARYEPTGCSASADNYGIDCAGLWVAERAVPSGALLRVKAAVSSTQYKDIRYTWSATGGRIVGSGNEVDFDSTGLEPGVYTIRLKVDDRHGHDDECSIEITVRRRGDPS